MPDDSARSEQFEKNAAAREAERGDYDPDRGDYDPDRGDYDPDRGDYDPDRGDYDPDRGGLGVGPSGAPASRVATDIFQRAASIGGHLIVAFVAPISSSTSSRRRSRTRASSCETEAAAAGAQVAALMEQIRESRLKGAKQVATSSPAPSNMTLNNAQMSTSGSTKQTAQTTSGSARRTTE